MNDEQWVALIRECIEQDIEKAVREIVSFSNYAQNYVKAEELLLELCACDESNIRGISILGLGHLARVHKRSSGKAVQVVKLALGDSDKYVLGHANSAADDISLFTEYKLNA